MQLLSARARRTDSGRCRHGTRGARTAPSLADEREATLHGHVAEICSAMDENDVGNVIFCGHSYGGLIACAAASERIERVHRLVLLDSCLPPDGLSLFDPMVCRCATSRGRQVSMLITFRDWIRFRRGSNRCAWTQKLFNARQESTCAAYEASSPCCQDLFLSASDWASSGTTGSASKLTQGTTAFRSGQRKRPSSWRAVVTIS